MTNKLYCHTDAFTERDMDDDRPIVQVESGKRSGLPGGLGVTRGFQYGAVPKGLQGTYRSELVHGID